MTNYESLIGKRVRLTEHNGFVHDEVLDDVEIYDANTWLFFAARDGGTGFIAEPNFFAKIEELADQR
jgi:hypothetical protein